MNSEVLFVHQDPLHPAHLGFGLSIKADFIPYNKYKLRIKRTGAIPYMMQSAINGIKLPDYKYYLCDGGATVLPAVIKKKTSSGEGMKIIDLIADETFVVQTLGIPQPNLKLNLMWKAIAGSISGGIAVSGLVRDAAAKVLKCPIRIAHPFIRDGLYEQLLNLKPQLRGNSIISVGYAGAKNGMDALVEAFRIVKRDFKDAELTIIGKGHPKEWEEITGVKIVGFVDELPPHLEKSALFVLVGRGQAFPVATLEALCSGLPVIVTKYTGTKDVIAKISRKFVCGLDADDIARAIMDYLALSHTERIELGQQAKRLGGEFNRENCCGRFKEEFNSLIKEIN